MHLIYADESGDDGLSGGGTPHFILSGVIVHETSWNPLFERIIGLRRELRKTYGVPQRIAFHGTDIVNGNGDYHHSRYGLSAQDRFDIYRAILEFTAKQTDLLRILNVFIRKDNIRIRTLDVFETAWRYFIQRIHNTITTGGELNRGDECAFLITDRTHDDDLRKLMRAMRAFNPVPSAIGMGTRNLLVERMLDDPVPRDSRHSYLVQLADLAAFSLFRRDHPRANLRPYRFETFFDILDPVLVKSANKANSQGILYWP
ncbi:MAG: DUF3800 domain-containing protein [Pyrinomonadaceae bacterium]